MYLRNLLIIGIQKDSNSCCSAKIYHAKNLFWHLGQMRLLSCNLNQSFWSQVFGGGGWFFFVLTWMGLSILQWHSLSSSCKTKHNFIVVCLQFLIVCKQHSSFPNLIWHVITSMTHICHALILIKVDVLRQVSYI